MVKIKSVLKNAVKATNKASTSAAKVAHAIQFATGTAILTLTRTKRVDGGTAWLGEKTNRNVPQTLNAIADKLRTAKLVKTTGKVLMVEGKTVYVWPVLAQGGDVYEREHYERNGKHFPVRGSLNLLRTNYGASKVRVVSVAEALKIVGSKKADALCVKNLKALAA